MGEERDCALMTRLAGVRMKPLMQQRRGGHGVQQQDKPGQQRGNDRPAGVLEMTRYEPHNKGKLADVMPDARVSCFRMAASA